jgi:hypothetical protein
MKSIARTLFGLALTVGFVAQASAQATTDIQLTRAHIQTARQAIIADAMQLTEDESVAFWPAYRDYRVEMARLGDRLVKVITEFVSDPTTLADEKANRLLDEYLSIKAQDVAVKKKYVPVFRKLLPAPKVTRFFQLENKLDAVVAFDLAATIPLAH